VDKLLFTATLAQSRNAKMSSLPTVESVVSETNKMTSAADSPKIDSRKRTRQSLQSPVPEASSVTAANTPSSGKRSRRIWTISVMDMRYCGYPLLLDCHCCLCLFMFFFVFQHSQAKQPFSSVQLHTKNRSLLCVGAFWICALKAYFLVNTD